MMSSRLCHNLFTLSHKKYYSIEQFNLVVVEKTMLCLLRKLKRVTEKENQIV